MSWKVGIDPKLHTIKGQFMSCLEKGHQTLLRLDVYSKSLVIYRELKRTNSFSSKVSSILQIVLRNAKKACLS